MRSPITFRRAESVANSACEQISTATTSSRSASTIFLRRITSSSTTPSLRTASRSRESPFDLSKPPGASELTRLRTQDPPTRLLRSPALHRPRLRVPAHPARHRDYLQLAHARSGRLRAFPSLSLSTLATDLPRFVRATTSSSTSSTSTTTGSSRPSYASSSATSRPSRRRSSRPTSLRSASASPMRLVVAPSSTSSSTSSGSSVCCAIRASLFFCC